jgi:hypothetical protein
MSGEAGHHPDPGQTAKTGMRPKKRTEEFIGGTSKREMGRVSQAGKGGRAHKDSGRSYLV